MYAHNNVKLAPLTLMYNHYEVISVNVKTSSTTKYTAEAKNIGHVCSFNGELLLEVQTGCV